MYLRWGVSVLQARAVRGPISTPRVGVDDVICVDAAVGWVCAIDCGSSAKVPVLHGRNICDETKRRPEKV